LDRYRDVGRARLTGGVAVTRTCAACWYAHAKNVPPLRSVPRQVVLGSAPGASNRCSSSCISGRACGSTRACGFCGSKCCAARIFGVRWDRCVSEGLSDHVAVEDGATYQRCCRRQSTYGELVLLTGLLMFVPAPLLLVLGTLVPFTRFLELIVRILQPFPRIGDGLSFPR
jgi:hypothetical protein